MLRFSSRWTIIVLGSPTVRLPTLSRHVKHLLSYWNSSVLPAPNIEAKADSLRLLRLLDQQVSDIIIRVISSDS